MTNGVDRDGGIKNRKRIRVICCGVAQSLGVGIARQTEPLFVHDVI